MKFGAVVAVALATGLLATACGSSNTSTGSKHRVPPTANMKPMARHRAAKFINIIPAAYPKTGLISTHSAPVPVANNRPAEAFAAKHESHDSAVQSLTGDDGLRRQLVRLRSSC